MNRTALATITGLILGLALVFGNFGDTLIVALFGAIGYVVAKILDGDIDAVQHLGLAVEGLDAIELQNRRHQCRVPR